MKEKVKMRLSSGICRALGLTVVLLLIQSGNLKYIKLKHYYYTFTDSSISLRRRLVEVLLLGEMNMNMNPIIFEYRLSCASAAVFDPNASREENHPSLR